MILNELVNLKARLKENHHIIIDKIGIWRKYDIKIRKVIKKDKAIK